MDDSMTTTVDELAQLHDCLLLSVIYDASSDDGRTVRWTLRCPSDLGYAPWDGMDIVVIARDVAMLRCVAWGIAGPETVSAFRAGISQGARDSTRGAREAGVRFPHVELTVEMHSGSWMEVICAGLEVEVVQDGV